MSRIKTIHKKRFSLKQPKLLGQRFGKLTVIGQLDEWWSNGERKLVCVCDCGWKVLVRGNNLKNSRTLSCGCTKGPKHNKTERASDIKLLSKVTVCGEEIYFFQLLQRVDMSEKKLKNATTRQGKTMDEIYEERYLSKQNKE